MAIRDNRDNEVAKSIMYTLELVAGRKPNDGSATYAVYAITQTDLQKVYAYFAFAISSVNEFEKQQKETRENKKEA